MRFQEIWLIFTLMTIVSFVNSHSLHGYIKNEKLRTAYRIVYRSQPWPVARDMCAEEGGKLAVPKSEEEFLFLQKLVRGMHYPAVTDAADKLVVWLGISNLHDHKIWTSVDGDDIREIGFDRWAGENGLTTSNAAEEPHCAALDAASPGLRDWWCHLRQPFLCQMQLDNDD
ncbi:secretory phospholipase A2 receptor [Papilio machaon]|uniref:secretory phospholipase A2 receptor n=1 Tax=Papilio machaon TaxID=76193 RepID=UPI001E665532|nr:secretory phospholipase A2 receptor [Papilio machaon]